MYSAGDVEGECKSGVESQHHAANIPLASSPSCRDIDTVPAHSMGGVSSVPALQLVPQLSEPQVRFDAPCVRSSDITDDDDDVSPDALQSSAPNENTSGHHSHRVGTASNGVSFHAETKAGEQGDGEHAGGFSETEKEYESDDGALLAATNATLASTHSVSEVLKQLQASELRRASQNTSAQASLMHTVRDDAGEDTFGPYVSTLGLHTESGAEADHGTLRTLGQHANANNTNSYYSPPPGSLGVAGRLARAVADPSEARMTWEDADTFGPYVSTFNLTHTEPAASTVTPAHNNNKTDSSTATTTTTAAAAASPLAIPESDEQSRLHSRRVSGRGVCGGGGGGVPAGEEEEERADEVDSGVRGVIVKRDSLSSNDDMLREGPIHQAGVGSGSAATREMKTDFVPLLHFRPAEFVPRLVFRGQGDDDEDDDEYDDDESDGVESRESEALSYPTEGPAHARESLPTTLALDVDGGEKDMPQQQHEEQQPQSQPPTSALMMGSGISSSLPTARHSASEAPAPVVVVVAEAKDTTRSTPTAATTVQRADAEEDEDEDWGEAVVSTQVPASHVDARSATAHAKPLENHEDWGEPAVTAPTSAEVGAVLPTSSSSSSSSSPAEPIVVDGTWTSPFSPSPAVEVSKRTSEVGSLKSLCKASANASGGGGILHRSARKSSGRKNVSFSLSDNVVVPPPPPEHALTSEYFYAEPDYGDIVAEVETTHRGHVFADDDDDGDELPAAPMMNSPSSSALFGRMAAPRLDGESARGAAIDADGETDAPVRKPRKLYFQSGFTAATTASDKTQGRRASESGDAPEQHPTPTATTMSAQAAANVVVSMPAFAAPPPPPAATDDAVITLRMPSVPGLIPGTASVPKSAAAESRTRPSLLSLNSFSHGRGQDPLATLEEREKEDDENEEKEEDNEDYRQDTAPLPRIVSLSLPAFADPAGPSFSTSSTTTAVPSPRTGGTCAGGRGRRGVVHVVDPTVSATSAGKIGRDDEQASDSAREEEVEEDAPMGLPRPLRHPKRGSRRRPGSLPDVSGGEDDEEGIDDEGEEGSLSLYNSQGWPMRTGRFARHRDSTASTIAGNNASSTFPYVSVGAPSHGQLDESGSRTVSPARSFLSPVSAITTPADRVTQMRRGLEQQMPAWARTFRQKEWDADDAARDTPQRSQPQRLSAASATTNRTELSRSNSLTQMIETEAERAVWRWPHVAGAGVTEGGHIGLPFSAWQNFPQDASENLGRLMQRKYASAGQQRDYAGGELEVGLSVHAQGASEKGSDGSSRREELAPPPPLPMPLLRHRRVLNVERVQQYLDEACATTATAGLGGGGCRVVLISPDTPRAAESPSASLTRRPFSSAHSRDLPTTTATKEAESVSPKSVHRGDRSRTSISAIHDVMQSLAFTPMRASDGTNVLDLVAPGAIKAPSHSTANPVGGGGGFWGWGGTAADVVVQAALAKHEAQQQMQLEQSAAFGVSEAGSHGAMMSVMESHNDTHNNKSNNTTRDNDSGSGGGGEQAGQPSSPLEHGLLVSDPVMWLAGYRSNDTTPTATEATTAAHAPGHVLAAPSGGEGWSPAGVVPASLSPQQQEQQQGKKEEEEKGDSKISVSRETEASASKGSTGLLGSHRGRTNAPGSPLGLEASDPATDLTMSHVGARATTSTTPESTRTEVTRRHSLSAVARNEGSATRKDHDLSLDTTRDFSEIFGVAGAAPLSSTPSLTSTPRKSAPVTMSGEARPALTSPTLSAATTNVIGTARAGPRVRAVSVGASGASTPYHGLTELPAASSPSLTGAGAGVFLASPLASSLSCGALGKSISFAHHSAQGSSANAGRTATARPSMSMSTLHTLYPLAARHGATRGGGTHLDASRRRSLNSLSTAHVVSPLSPSLEPSLFSRVNLAPTGYAFSEAATPSARRASATGPAHYTALSGGVSTVNASSRPRAVSLQQQLQSMVLEQSVSASGVPEDVLTVLQLEEERRSGRRGSAHETLADFLSASQRPQM